MCFNNSELTPDGGSYAALRRQLLTVDARELAASGYAACRPQSFPRATPVRLILLLHHETRKKWSRVAIGAGALLFDGPRLPPACRGAHHGRALLPPAGHPGFSDPELSRSPRGTPAGLQPRGIAGRGESDGQDLRRSPSI
eukprot:tig00000382_g24553.t1